MKRIFYLSLMALIVGGILTGCKGKKAGGELKPRLFSNPDMLNPVNSRDAATQYIIPLIFSALEGIDPDSYILTPDMATARPKITEITDGEYKGGVKLEYEIRSEAKWDNGTPITADDYLLSIKAILNPKTNCQPLKPYYDWLGDIVVDPANNKKFTVYAKEKYFKIEQFAGTASILPEYVYDPQKLMRKFKVTDLNSDTKRDALKDNADIQAFATQFNSEKFQREKDGVVGAGAYKFESWVTGQTLTLVRKKNWWGDKVSGVRDFVALPDRIVFKVINDQNAAIAALKDGGVDDYSSIPAKLFQELKKNDSAKVILNIDSPSTFLYTFMALNTRNAKLSDKKVREAIAHCINKKQINDVLAFGMSKPVETFVHPKQKHYNGDIKPFDYDLDKARALLDEAGWKDTDGDGIRDKMINGERVKLNIDFKIPAGNKGREETGLLIQEDLKKVGVSMTITAREGSVFQQDLDKRDFEMSYVAYTMDPVMSDPKQLWSTVEAAPGGSNMCGFGTEATDKLIETLRAEMDESKRIELYRQLQLIVHDEIPCIFMFSPVNRMATNKRFEVKKTMLYSPGYLYNEFKAVSSTSAN
jgi:peptide/nickel transport system substrate-binding protein